MDRNIHFSRRWLTALAVLPLVLVALAVAVLAIDSSDTGPAYAHEEPAGCFRNLPSVEIARLPSCRGKRPNG